MIVRDTARGPHVVVEWAFSPGVTVLGAWHVSVKFLTGLRTLFCRQHVQELAIHTVACLLDGSDENVHILNGFRQRYNHRQVASSIA